MEIRTVEREDVPEWVRMRCALYPGHSPASIEREAELALADTSRSAVFVSVRGDGKLGGFLEASIRTEYVLGWYSKWFGFIESWYVDFDLRQQGIGALLVKAAEMWAIGRGCHEMASDCYLENEVSLQAHLGVGFQEMGRVIHFRKDLIG